MALTGSNQADLRQLHHVFKLTVNITFPYAVTLTHTTHFWIAGHSIDIFIADERTALRAALAIAISAARR